MEPYDGEMVARLILIIFLFIIGGILSSRVLYILLHIEGALLSAIAAIYLADLMVSL
ncbi:MAG: hypothetical protein MJE68_12620 [Proteobacteria bacterium]|nr:hypothetical protein [Pseudomonadota bacterium]